MSATADHAADDARVLGPGLLPTPFTADEIRANTPEGRTCRTRIEPAGGAAYVRVSRYVAGDTAGATMQRWTEKVEGQVTAEVSELAVTWADLQRHAAFPEQVTTVADETLAGALGSMRCRTYAVRDDDHVTTFWFDLDRPGAPVRIVAEEQNAVVEVAEMVQDRVT